MAATPAEGTFAGRIETHAPGLYSLRLRARGRSLHGAAFTREATLTVAAIRNPEPAAPDPGDGGDRGDRIWDLIECILGGAKSEICGLDPEQLRRCLEKVRAQGRRAEPPRSRAKEVRLAARSAAFSLAAAPQEPIARLTEPPPRPEFPAEKHHEGMPMFGLSPEDQEIEDRRRAKLGDKPAPGGDKPAPGGDKPAPDGGGGHGEKGKDKPGGGEK